MGFLKKLKAKTDCTRSMGTYRTQLEQWQEESDHVEDLLHFATNLDEVYEMAASAGFSVRLRKDEHILVGLSGGSALVEPRSTGGSYQGG